MNLSHSVIASNMMSFKIITIACLIAAVYANPTVEHENGVITVSGGLGGALNGLIRGVGHVVGGVTNTAGNLVGGVVNGAGHLVHNLVTGGNGQVNGNLGLGGVLQPLINVLTAVTGSARDLLTDLSKLKIPGTLDDVLNLLISVGISVGDILNAILPGVGTAVARLVVGLLKILICALGSPGLTGTLLGDRRPGINNPSNIPAICGPSYGGHYGVDEYHGDCHNVTQIYNFYNLGDIDSIIRAAIEAYTNGAGVNGLNGSQQYTVQWILQLTAIVKKYPNSDFSEKDLTLVATLLIKILGGIGNSYQSGVGNKIVAKLVAYLNASSKGIKITIDLEAELPAINQDIDRCYSNNFGGAINPCANNGNQTNTNGNNGQNNNNNNGQNNNNNNGQNNNNNGQNNNGQNNNNNNGQNNNNNNNGQNNNNNGQNNNNNNGQNNNNNNGQNNNGNNGQNNNGNNGQNNNNNGQNNNNNGQNNNNNGQNNNNNGQNNNNNGNNGQNTNQGNANDGQTTYNATGSSNNYNENTQEGGQRVIEQNAAKTTNSTRESGQEVYQDADVYSYKGYDKESNSTSDVSNNKDSSSYYNNTNNTGSNSQYEENGVINGNPDCQD